MAETQSSMQIAGAGAGTVRGIRGYAAIAASDAVQLTDQVGEWGFEFSQLKPGKFRACGPIIDLDGVHIAQVEINQTLLHRGSAPRHTVAVLVPGAGSGQVFAHGQLLKAGECVTLAEGATLEAVTHGRYMDVAFAFDMHACRAQIDALTGGDIGVGPGATCVAPGAVWIDNMLNRVARLCSCVEEYPQCLSDAGRRASLADHVLVAMAHLDTSPADIDATTRSAHASRRVAVRLALDFIHSRLSEPLRLSELCRHAQLKIRSLEYGFREVTGLTPIAYIRSLRLNTVRRLLSHDATARNRSISEIALDTGFWHLSQFAMDYRRFFGEAPTQTRQRALGRSGEISVMN